MRPPMRIHNPSPHTIPGRRAIERALKRLVLESSPSSQLEIKRIQTVGRGAHRVAFQVDMKVRPDPEGLSGEHVVLFPYPEEAEEIRERLEREAKALRYLAQVSPIFRFPKLISSVTYEGAVVICERFVEGVALDLRAGRCLVGQPWEVAGEIAARVHDLKMVADRLDGFETRRAHALDHIQILNTLGESTFQDAHQWCLENLPPEEPSTLLHGDLSGQNILVDPKGLKAPALIDWTFVLRGDPAHELAIITQGKRRPFEVDLGHERLLDAYLDAGGREVKLNEIYLYELCLFGRRYYNAKTKRATRVENPQEPLRLAYHLLARLKRARSGENR